MRFYPQVILWTYVVLPAIALLLLPHLVRAVAKAQHNRAKLLSNALHARNKAAPLGRNQQQRRYNPYSSYSTNARSRSIREVDQMDGFMENDFDDSIIQAPNPMFASSFQSGPGFGPSQRFESMRQASDNTYMLDASSPMLARMNEPSEMTEDGIVASNWDQQQESLGVLQNMWNMNGFGANNANSEVLRNNPDDIHNPMAGFEEKSASADPSPHKKKKKYGKHYKPNYYYPQNYYSSYASAYSSYGRNNDQEGEMFEDPQMDSHVNEEEFSNVDPMHEEIPVQEEQMRANPENLPTEVPEEPKNDTVGCELEDSYEKKDKKGKYPNYDPYVYYERAVEEMADLNKKIKTETDKLLHPVHPAQQEPQVLPVIDNTNNDFNNYQSENEETQSDDSSNLQSIPPVMEEKSADPHHHSRGFSHTHTITHTHSLNNNFGKPFQAIQPVYEQPKYNPNQFNAHSSSAHAASKTFNLNGGFGHQVQPYSNEGFIQPGAQATAQAGATGNFGHAGAQAHAQAGTQSFGQTAAQAVANTGLNGFSGTFVPTTAQALAQASSINQQTGQIYGLNNNQREISNALAGSQGGVINGNGNTVVQNQILGDSQQEVQSPMFQVDDASQSFVGNPELVPRVTRSLGGSNENTPEMPNFSTEFDNIMNRNRESVDKSSSEESKESQELNVEPIKNKFPQDSQTHIFRVTTTEKSLSPTTEKVYSSSRSENLNLDEKTDHSSTETNIVQHTSTFPTTQSSFETKTSDKMTTIEPSTSNWDHKQTLVTSPPNLDSQNNGNTAQNDNSETDGNQPSKQKSEEINVPLGMMNPDDLTTPITVTIEPWASNWDYKRKIEFPVKPKTNEKSRMNDSSGRNREEANVPLGMMNPDDLTTPITVTIEPWASNWDYKRKIEIPVKSKTNEKSSMHDSSERNRKEGNVPLGMINPDDLTTPITVTIEPWASNWDYKRKIEIPVKSKTNEKSSMNDSSEKNKKEGNVPLGMQNPDELTTTPRPRKIEISPPIEKSSIDENSESDVVLGMQNLDELTTITPVAFPEEQSASNDFKRNSGSLLSPIESQSTDISTIYGDDIAPSKPDAQKTFLKQEPVELDMFDRELDATKDIIDEVLGSTHKDQSNEFETKKTKASIFDKDMSSLTDEEIEEVQFSQPDNSASNEHIVGASLTETEHTKLDTANNPLETTSSPNKKSPFSFNITGGPFSSIEEQLSELTEDERETFLKQEMKLISDVIDEALKKKGSSKEALHEKKDETKNKDIKEIEVSSPNLMNVRDREYIDEYRRDANSNEQQHFDAVLGQQREQVESIKELSNADPDLGMISSIGESVLNDLETRNHQTKNSPKKQDKTKRSIEETKKNPIPLTHWVSDPTTKVDVPKTLQNIGSVTKHTFENVKAPIYHTRNMIGNTKNMILSVAKIPPNNLFFPSKYEIIKVDDKDGGGDTLGAINQQMLISRSGDPTEIKNNQQDSQMSQEKKGVTNTFTKLGNILKNSVDSGKDTIGHFNDVATDIRNVVYTSKHAAPRIIVPSKIPSLITKDAESSMLGKKAVLIAPRILDLAEDPVVSQPEQPSNFVGAGDVLDALGLSYPNQPEVPLEKIVLEPSAINVLKQFDIPKELRSSHPLKDWVKENFKVNQNQPTVVGEAKPESVKDFLKRMQQELKEKLRSENLERASKRKEKSNKSKNKKYKKSQKNRKSDKPIGKSIQDQTQNLRDYDNIIIQPIKQNEGELVGIFLSPELMKPFMGQPSQTMIQDYFRENGDASFDGTENHIISKNNFNQNIPSNLNDRPPIPYSNRNKMLENEKVNYTSHTSDLGHILGAINPMMLERYFNERIDRTDSAHKDPFSAFSIAHVDEGTANKDIVEMPQLTNYNSQYNGESGSIDSIAHLDKSNGNKNGVNMPRYKNFNNQYDGERESIDSWLKLVEENPTIIEDLNNQEQTKEDYKTNENTVDGKTQSMYGDNDKQIQIENKIIEHVPIVEVTTLINRVIHNKDIKDDSVYNNPVNNIRLSDTGTKITETNLKLDIPSEQQNKNKPLQDENGSSNIESRTEIANENSQQLLLKNSNESIKNTPDETTLEMIQNDKQLKMENKNVHEYLNVDEIPTSSSKSNKYGSKEYDLVEEVTLNPLQISHKTYNVPDKVSLKLEPPQQTHNEQIMKDNIQVHPQFINKTMTSNLSASNNIEITTSSEEIKYDGNKNDKYNAETLGTLTVVREGGDIMNKSVPTVKTTEYLNSKTQADHVSKNLFSELTDKNAIDHSKISDDNYKVQAKEQNANGKESVKNAFPKIKIKIGENINKQINLENKLHSFKVHETSIPVNILNDSKNQPDEEDSKKNSSESEYKETIINENNKKSIKKVIKTTKELENGKKEQTNNENTQKQSTYSNESASSTSVFNKNKNEPDDDEESEKDARTSMKIYDTYQKPFMGLANKDKIHKFLDKYNTPTKEQNEISYDSPIKDFIYSNYDQNDVDYFY
ncbi:uncharacterized protein LOC115887745 [Sitophilus oryzae]|uniref:Uncharacterized protein LOC115887745 n=1 Tax=Sitophilus oryzae TaxID=7048 RepID=A0A6J2YII0_SITOR|nr:uncharacterized protein LOC115887745 [Sitophilus oryzae]